MESWKSHVRAELFHRDKLEKDQFVGVFNRLFQLAERLKFRKEIWGDVHTKSLDGGRGVDVGNSRLLHLQLRESENLAEKLSQSVSDLTSVLYMKEAELLYRQSQVSRYRKEALALAKGHNSLQATLSEHEFTIESQSKELAALLSEQTELREGLAVARRETEELLQRWMKEKRAEAERVNKYNDAQEKWHRLARRLNRRLHREMGKHPGLPETNSWSGTTERL